MIERVGLDLVSVHRIAKAMRRGGFVTRILTPLEQAYCDSPLRVAGRWAAKEATFKATGLKLHWQEIEVYNDECGFPQVAIACGKLLKGRLHLSITHEDGMAAAVAVWET